MEDMFQEGVIGLMKAAERFDASLGYQFSTYAVWWIKSSIERHLKDRCSTIRVKDTYRKQTYHKFLSLEQELNDKPESNARLEDILGDSYGANPEYILENLQSLESADELLFSLSDREKDIIKRYYGFYGEEQTYRQIGYDVGVTASRVEQIKSAAIKKLREHFGTPIDGYSL